MESAVSISKRVNVKTGKGKVMGVVREQYLRDDVPCQSALCFEGCCNGEGLAALPADVTHYLLPLEDVVRGYLEVLEAEPQLRGVIYLQSVVGPVQLASQRHYRKICAQVRDPARGAVFFPNEFCRRTHVTRRRDEDLTAHRNRMAIAAAGYYYEHLGGQKPVVVVTENPAVVTAYGSRRLEVFVVTLGEYLDKFWPKLETLRELYNGISEALQSQGEDEASESEFSDYLKLEVLEAGVKKGKFVQGRLEVNKHHSMKEAFVVRQGGSADKKGFDSGDVLVPGLTMRNRAIHGDIVVVQLLPKSEWKGRLNTLAERSEAVEKEVAEDKWEKRADVSPTGKVVGVVQRCWREYVATIPRAEAEEAAEQRKTSKRVLVVPYDRRVPKVRVLTSQATRLAGQRIVVSVDSWPASSRYPNGHFVRALGAAGHLETEVDGILLENGISVTPFSQGVLREMPATDWNPEKEEVAKRKDLRNSHQVGCLL